MPRDRLRTTVLVSSDIDPGLCSKGVSGGDGLAAVVADLTVSKPVHLDAQSGT